MVPDDKKERVTLSKKLQKYNISLTQYVFKCIQLHLWLYLWSYLSWDSV